VQIDGIKADVIINERKSTHTTEHIIIISTGQSASNIDERKSQNISNASNNIIIIIIMIIFTVARIHPVHSMNAD